MRVDTKILYETFYKSKFYITIFKIADTIRHIRWVFNRRTYIDTENPLRLRKTSLNLFLQLSLHLYLHLHNFAKRQQSEFDFHVKKRDLFTICIIFYDRRELRVRCICMVFFFYYYTSGLSYDLNRLLYCH